MNDEKVTILVISEGQGRSNPLTEKDGAEIFFGDENKLNYINTYSEKLDCTFDLRSYPFDTQVCSIMLKVPKSSIKQVQLVASKSFFNGTMVLPQFEVL